MAYGPFSLKDGVLSIFENSVPKGKVSHIPVVVYFYIPLCIWGEFLLPLAVLITKVKENLNNKRALSEPWLSICPNSGSNIRIIYRLNLKILQMWVLVTSVLTDGRFRLLYSHTSRSDNCH